jgi:hypothetical protein
MITSFYVPPMSNLHRFILVFAITLTAWFIAGNIAVILLIIGYAVFVWWYYTKEIDRN